MAMKTKNILVFSLTLCVCILICFLVLKTVLRFPINAKDYSYTSEVPFEHNLHRVAVFASYSATGKIPDYVIYYLKELKKVSDAIIFISDNPIIPAETDKIKDLVYHMEFKRHNEYDFGSYKRGLFYLRKNRLLNADDSLILANDSCYGAVYPFESVFEKMEENPVDFWGLASNYEHLYHLQSYFLVFSPKILSTIDLDLFLYGVRKKDKAVEYVLNYEIILTAYLHFLGYTHASYLPDAIPTSISPKTNTNKAMFPYTLVYKYHFPLIKRKVFFPEFASYVEENPKKVIKILKEINPELYKIIIADNPSVL